MGAWRMLKRGVERDILKWRPIDEYGGDGLRVRKRNLTALREPKFVAAWDRTAKAFKAWKGKPVPEIAWRAHVCCWAARSVLANPHGGDFVDCGVYVGLLARTVCEYVDFGSTDRTWWLLDTYSGLPVPKTDRERQVNATEYAGDYYDVAAANFAPYPNVRLVRGAVPGTLGQITSDRIGYLSIDMNNVEPEIAAIEGLWDRLVPGALVILDDYGFSSYEAQQCAMDRFAESKNTMVGLLPTGQGLIVKPGS